MTPTTHEHAVLILIGMIVGGIIAAAGAWLCDWLEKKYPPDYRPIRGRGK